MMVPHSIITVSLATAILPRLSALAADGDLAGLARSLASTLRAALAVIVPFAALLPVIADDISNVIWGHGAGADLYDRYVPTLSLFGGGLLFFTVHYLMLRGFYALEATRTVFWIQCGVAATNIAVAVVFVARADAEDTSPALVLAYTAAYAVGSVLSYAVLRAPARRPRSRRVPAVPRPARSSRSRCRPPPPSASPPAPRLDRGSALGDAPPASPP